MLLMFFFTVDIYKFYGTDCECMYYRLRIKKYLKRRKRDGTKTVLAENRPFYDG